MEMDKHVALVGVDWGDKKHAYEVRGADGRRRQGEFEQRPAAVHAWVASLRTEYPEGTIALAIEQSRGALLYALSRYEFLELLPVHPTRTAAYRRFTRPSGAKSDPIDAGLICDYVDKHGEQIRPWQPADSITRELLLLVEWRRKLIEQRVGFSHQLRDTLKQYFPQALEWAGELGSPMSLDFLERWPTLGQLQRSRSCTVRSFYTQHGSRSAELIERRVGDIATASPLHTDPALLSALSSMVLSLVPIVRALSEQLRKIDQRIAQLWTDHPDRQLFESFPGAGEALAPRLAVALGTDRSRWTASSLQTFSGIAPLTVQSGASRWVHSRWNCPKFLRQTFHEFAECSIPHCRWAAAFYAHQRSRGKSYHAALRALAARWIRVIVRCWLDRIPYDDARYAKRLIQAGSPLAAALVT
jgi:transposase